MSENLKKGIFYVAIVVSAIMFILIALALSYIVNFLFVEFWQRTICIIILGILFGLCLMLPWFKHVLSYAID
jgi:hypothetical protein